MKRLPISFFSRRSTKPNSDSDAESSDSRPKTWQRLRRLFAEAIQVNTVERTAWLKKHGDDDSAVVREVISLLEHDCPDSRFLESPACILDTQSVSDTNLENVTAELHPGSVVGSWEVVRKISSGGMGAVYLAERTVESDQSVKQRAAIKVMRQRVDPESFALRFRRERRILAKLNHPFVARFLEGGTLENGQPYFVLDYIDGEPIKHYCTNHRLELEEILELFNKVCSAVAYAHRNLIVHRDLKPSNILMTADGTPRLIDFGIAKLLTIDEGSCDAIEQTVGIGPCTPRYSSPEQIRGEQISTAADIFALGIVLYELLTGVHPFVAGNDSESVGEFEVLRRICGEEPKRPSDCAQKQGRPFYRKLRGDLEAVVLKALQKKPSDRYKSVEYLIDDIESFLLRRPVLARRQSWWYRTHRLVSRYPTATGSVLVAGTIGILAIGAVLVSDRATKQESDYALRQRELATSSAQTMIDEAASSLESMVAPVEHRLELLNRIAAIFDELDSTSRSPSDPAASPGQIRAAIQTQTILASAMQELGDIRGATERARGAVLLARKLAKSEPGDADDELMLTKALLTMSHIGSKTGSGTTDELLAEALATLRGIEKKNPLTAASRLKLEVLLSDALRSKVENRDGLANPQESLRFLTEAIKYGEQAYQAHPSNGEAIDAYASSLERLAAFYNNWGRSSLVQETLKKALAIRRKAAADAPGSVGLQRLYDKAVARWGSVLALNDNSGRAPISPSEDVPILRRLRAIDPNNVNRDEDLLRELLNSTVLYSARRDYAEAINLAKEGTELVEELRNKGLSNFQIENLEFDNAVGLSFSYTRTGDLDAARSINLNEVSPLLRRLNSLDSNQANNRFRECEFCAAQAEVATASVRWQEAKLMWAEAVDILQQNLTTRDYPAERSFYANCVERYGKALCELGDRKSGCQRIAEGLEILKGLGDRLVPRSDGLNDIADAEKDLQYYQQRSGKGPDVVPSTTR